MTTTTEPATDTPLATRQQDVLRLVVLGAKNPEIGRELYLSEDTVKTHLRRLFEKAGAADRVQLAVWAVRTGHFKIEPIERDWGLSNYEQQILQAIAEEGRNKPAAEALGLTPAAIKSHLDRIGHKMNTNRRVCMVIRAIQAGQVKA